MSEPVVEAPKLPDSSLKTRLRSALILAPVVLFVLWVGSGAFTLMMALAGGIAVFEWTRMVLIGQANTPQRFSEFAGFLAGLGIAGSGMTGNPAVGFWFFLALGFLLFAYNFSQKGPSLRQVIFGFIYIGFAVSVMVWLRNGTAYGLYHMLTLLFIVWASDSFAYFAGRAIGGPKLAPVISPKKTWSGFFGGSVGSALVAAGMSCPFVLNVSGVETLGGMGPTGYAVMGFFLSMVGQGGDLFKSIFKRHYGIKDTGAIIPGHGGVLDRIDALLMVALVFGVIAVVAG